MSIVDVDIDMMIETNAYVKFERTTIEIILFHQKTLLQGFRVSRQAEWRRTLKALWKRLYLVKGDREMTLPDKLLIVQSGKQTTCVDNPLVTILSNVRLYY